MNKTIKIMSLGIVLLVIILFLISSNNNTKEHQNESYLYSSASPNATYFLDAYKTEPGATVDFSIKVYLVDGEKEKLIYNAYHEYQVEIIWLNDYEVSINGKVLNLQKNEVYDWRSNK